ncbi:MAG: hypothetical protein RLO18_25555, partial [Gimesia chilikensis]
MNQLKFLGLKNTQVSSQAARKLQKEIPGCRIRFDSPVAPSDLKLAEEINKLEGSVSYRDSG